MRKSRQRIGRPCATGRDGAAYGDPRGHGGGPGYPTATPIQHLVVIIGENESFDHYFGTYPHAANTDGQPFHAAPGTPAVDGLPKATSRSLPPALRHPADLLTANPNTAQPRRLDSSPAGLPGDAGGQLTCDQENNYGPEQQAFDGGKMDSFVQSTGVGTGTSDFGAPCQAATVMDHYDGNTLTARPSRASPAAAVRAAASLRRRSARPGWPLLA